jgi:hypothetical protein
MLLLMRNSFTDIGPLQAGLTGLGQLAIAGGAGVFIAGISINRIVAQLGTKGTVCLSLLVAAAIQFCFGIAMSLPMTLLAAFSLTCAGQLIKLCVDAAVQSDIADQSRGRVFAIYDTLFNVIQVCAITVAAMVLPLSGQSASLTLALMVCYLIGFAGYLVMFRRTTPATATNLLE